MTDQSRTFDNLERGHVVLAPDPFKPERDATRPWVIVNTEAHPFDKQQYIAMGLTTKTWYDDRIRLQNVDFVDRTAPRDSSIVPHALASIRPMLMTDYVCRIRGDPLNQAVKILTSYLTPE